ncbi:MAG: ribbon-helix-helix domain-containing protein [Rhodospirillaceae bacterium]
MAKAMNVSLTEPLRAFVNSRTGDQSLFATPSEYIRDLIRRDMEQAEIVEHVVQGLNDLQNGRLSEKSILDLADEDD